MSLHIRNGTVERHRRVVLILEDIEVVEAVRVVEGTVPASARCLIRYPVPSVR